MSKSIHIDTSKELLIRNNSYGIQLLRPETVSRHEREQLYKVAHVLDMPFCVYFMDTESVLKNVNDYSASSCGFISTGDAVGRSARDIATKQSADVIINHDKMVLEQKKMIVQDEPFQQLEHSIVRPSVAFKFPLLNEEMNLVGLFGCSIVLNDQQSSFANAINLLIQLGLLAQPNLSKVAVKQDSQSANLKQQCTVREIEILSYLVCAKSAKEIGKILNISYRTVEDYTEKLKLKLNAKNKNELIKIVNEFHYHELI